jgi:DNA-binding NarL/FixJ family response regulator
MTDSHRRGRTRGGLARVDSRPTRDLEPNSKVGVLAHPSLREHLHPGNARWGNLLAPPFKVEYVDYEEMSVRARIDNVPVMLPVNTEHQAEILGSVRAGYAMGIIVAVTNDVTGYSTYFAIRSGANLVLNVAISGQRQAEILRDHLREHFQPPETTLQRSAPEPVKHQKLGGQGIAAADSAVIEHESARGHIHSSLSGRYEFDIRLLQMLRSKMTVAEIARESYISERSMYRRIRCLYDKLGVDSRAELITLSDQDDCHSKLSALA